MYDRRKISGTTRRRRRIIENVELAIAAVSGAGLYVLAGLCLRWLGV